MRLIAHRGFALRFPENTVFAAAAAAEVADLVEVDVRRCGTGEPVVVHDGTVDRVTDGTGRVADHSLSALRDLDVLDSGEPIPTLRAVFDAVPASVGVNVELKEPEVAADAVAVAADADNDVLVSSFDPAVPLAHIFEAGPREGLATAREFGCAAVHPYHECCTAAFVERAHAGGLSVHAWTVADAATADRLHEVGVDGVIADRPGVLEAA